MSTAASIKALPPSTVHRIGSSQVLVDPSSVVKELLDNSIDARATSVSIEISANTLDVIQVTDNGYGIIPEDRAMVCRRYTTSKICEFSDLVELGGTSLGFRGEALHSLANLSGSLSITTRVDGEMAALKLIVATTGEVEGRETASHPVGTTVRANNFFSSLPVRKQTGLKAATKTLVKIKRMLQAYALTRPSIRFSLRVLKAKTATGNFIYAPKLGASSVRDAALKISGSTCISQCSWHVLQSHGFEIQVLCPTSEAVAAKISNTGQFLSVDSRPMTACRGIMKQIITLFKEKLRKSNESLGSIKDPFLCFNIVCPTASYDPNIEPSKDDVLFDDSVKVIAAVKELLAVIYPVQECEKSAQSILFPASALHRPEAVPPLQSRQRQLSPKMKAPPAREVATTVEEVFEEEIVLDDEEMSLLDQRARTSAWRSNMYGCDEEDLELLGGTEQRPLTQESAVDLKEAAREFNPWTIAKMNASVRPNSTNDGVSCVRLVQQSASGRNENSLLTPTHHSVGRLPVTPASSWTAINQHQDSMHHGSPATIARQSQNAAYGFPTPHASSSPTFGTLLEDIQESTLKVRPSRPKANVRKPFSNTMKDSNWDFGPPSWPKKKSKPQGHRSSQDIRDAFGGAVSRRSPQDLPVVIQGEPVEERAPSSDAMLLEFNARLCGSEAVAEAPPEARCNATNMADSQGRTAAKLVKPSRRSLRTCSRPKTGEIVDPENPGLDKNDDYHPPAKRRRTTEGAKRSKSSQLPLERIPEKQQLHKILLKTKISLKDITNDLDRRDRSDILSNDVLWDCDSDFAGSVSAFDEGIDPNVFQAWTRRIKVCLERKLRRLEKDGDDEEVLTCIGALSRLARMEKGVENDVGWMWGSEKGMNLQSR